ncbi:hypothetical protein [Sphingosinicella sp. BN140058]|uniref:hypothetical protein n=1 Tax=Sphingosinicella sp. BN140058 TaxID=1892855 RepID=UPI001012BED5|nr:hypothetical protein [Sphingosinicella sp. BN140058]QAY80252.1 hypothetical protein ETR14_26780 [Sphingosinicella sp. BN140058]
MLDPRIIPLDVLLASPFFILSGESGIRLACQWTDRELGPSSTEFEVITPANPDLIGCIFGVYDAENDEFRLRPAVDRDSGVPRPDLPVNTAWRGSLSDILEAGCDWEWDRKTGSLTLLNAVLPLAA